MSRVITAKATALAHVSAASLKVRGQPDDAGDEGSRIVTDAGHQGEVANAPPEALIQVWGWS